MARTPALSMPASTNGWRTLEEYYPAFKAHLAARGDALPDYVEQEFEGYLKCGRLEHGFLRVRCGTCHAEHLVAFSCKRRGFCPSCGARRMVESAALLVDEVFPEQPVRQWVLSVPFPLRFLFASRPDVMGRVLGIVYRCIATHLCSAYSVTVTVFPSLAHDSLVLPTLRCWRIQ
jgi:ribosomal protein S27E